MSLFGDVRYAFRQMRRGLGVSLTAMISIALGIGAATAIFSVIHGVIIDPFPYKDVDSLMSIAIQEPGQRGFRTGYTVDQFLEIRERSRIFNRAHGFDDQRRAVDRRLATRSSCGATTRRSAGWS